MKYFISVIFLVSLFSAFTVLTGGNGLMVSDDTEGDRNVAQATTDADSG